MKKEIKKLVLLFLTIFIINVLFYIGNTVHEKHVEKMRKEKHYIENTMRFNYLLKAGDYKLVNYKSLIEKDLDSIFSNASVNLHLNKDTNIKYSQYIISLTSIYTNIEVNDTQGWIELSPFTGEEKIDFLRSVLAEDLKQYKCVKIFPFNDNNYVLANHKILNLQNNTLVWKCIDEVCEVDTLSDTLKTSVDLSSTKNTYSKDGRLLSSTHTNPNYFIICLYILNAVLIIFIVISLKKILLSKFKNNDIEILIIKVFDVIKSLSIIFGLVVGVLIFIIILCCI